jgi:Protein of unknown function (DUF2281)
MSTHPQDAQALIEKIQSLPAERMAEAVDYVDFLIMREARQRKEAKAKKPLDFPVDDLGQWPEGLSLRREDMYGDDGR